MPASRNPDVGGLLAVDAVETLRRNEADGHLSARCLADNCRNSFPEEIVQTSFPLHSITDGQLRIELEPESAWHDLRV